MWVKLAIELTELPEHHVNCSGRHPGETGHIDHITHIMDQQPPSGNIYILYYIQIYIKEYQS